MSSESGIITALKVRECAKRISEADSINALLKA